MAGAHEDRALFTSGSKIRTQPVRHTGRQRVSGRLNQSPSEYLGGVTAARRQASMIAAIATAAIYVDDQTRSLEFWTERVGFSVHRSLSMGPNAAWIEVGPVGAQSCLVLYPRAMMSDAAERKPSIVFTCENIEQTYQEMTARGIVFTQPPQSMGWGMFAIFNDLDGNWYGLRQGEPG
jgi:lactoylglutathione lyase